jgi:transposase
MHHVPGKSRDERIDRSLEELVQPTSFARIIDAFVDALDLASFGFTYFQLNEEGRPPYHPAVLLKLCLYGYHHGIRPCRKLAEACRLNIEVMWLVERRQPSYTAINNFRKDNATAFREVSRRFVFVLREWKLIGGKTIAIDSFKIRAQNSLKNNYNAAKIKRHRQYADRKLAEYQAELDEEDADEEGLREKIATKQGQVKKYERLERQLGESPDGQLSTTDADARAVVFQRNSVRVGYNVQAAADARHKLLVAMDTGSVNDTDALSGMIERVATNIDKPSFRVLADKGYHNGRELAAAEALGVRTYVSPKASSSSKARSSFAIAQFRYTPRTDTYTCPAGEILRTNGRYYDKPGREGRRTYRVKHYKTKACADCPLRSQCTSNKLGRLIERSEYQPYIDRNNRRVNRDLDFYRQRQLLIEHQFGTLKRQRGFEHVLLRGKTAVLGEVSLMFLTYNLGRTVSILGFSCLLRRLRACFRGKSVIFLCWCRRVAAVNGLLFGCAVAAGSCRREEQRIWV